MSLFTLFTYRGINELRQIQSQYDVIPFVFDETKDSLEENSTIVVDITALVYMLQTNKGNRYYAYLNLREMTDETRIIVEEELAENALSIFSNLFCDYSPLLDTSNQIEQENVDLISTFSRQTIYTYHNNSDLANIIDYANLNDIPMTTFSRTSGTLTAELEKFNQFSKMVFVDLTSITYIIESNKSLIYTVELFLNQFPNIKLMVLTSQIDSVIKYFPLYIDGQKHISNLIPELAELTPVDETMMEIKKVTALSRTESSTFIESFNHNLIGHDYFKKRFKNALTNFVALNNVGEQKVFSIFLFGASGIGKTEVARLIANGLQQNSYLAKINFQNYSSQDSLNSLIGSPAGYIGCEHGELSEKVKKSKIGVVLCDEFEKTTRPVYSFFLELLEEGKFTDSMAREYDLNGYILIFISNLTNESDYKKSYHLNCKHVLIWCVNFKNHLTLKKLNLLTCYWSKQKQNS